MDGEYFWECQLLDNVLIEGGGSIMDNFTATVTDPQGDSASAGFGIEVIDDAPLLDIEFTQSVRTIGEGIDGDDEDLDADDIAALGDPAVLFANLDPNGVDPLEALEGAEILGVRAASRSI